PPSNHWTAEPAGPPDRRPPESSNIRMACWDFQEQGLQMILVTGGAGFIGANFVLQWCAAHAEPVLNLDALTYAGNLETLQPVLGRPNHMFVQGDIADTALVAELLPTHRPRAILHFAAESHVDRSILGPEAFVQTNVVGTFRLLEAVRQYWQALPAGQAAAFRFLHVSTDEVYGTLGPDDAPFSEDTPYAPNSRSAEHTSE